MKKNYRKITIIYLKNKRKDDRIINRLADNIIDTLKKL